MIGGRGWLLLSLLMVMAISSRAAEGVKLTGYGFVGNQMFYSDRESMQGADGLFYIMPLDRREDSNGEDVNRHSELTFLSMITRVGVNISAPDMLGASSTGKIETDFAIKVGQTYGLRLRRAFFNFAWRSDRLLLGQEWHPMSADILPDVPSISMGSPFNPFNRSPQIRWDHRFAKGLNTTLAAIFQSQYTSIGPNGKSSEYQRNSMTPDLYFGLTYSAGGFQTGIGAEYQYLVPRRVALSGTPRMSLVEESVSSICGMFQASYTKGRLSIKGKTMWGENMSHLGICSGYGVNGIDASTNSYTYEPLTALSSWAMLSYGDRCRFSLFGGYMCNLGSRTEYLLPEMNLYVFGGNRFDQAYRVSPSVLFKVENLQLALEYELTAAAYGNLEPNGNVVNSHWVANNRVLLSTIYSF